VEVNVSIAKDREEQLEGFLCTIRDLTERKRAEQEQARRAQQLAQQQQQIQQAYERQQRQQQAELQRQHQVHQPHLGEVAGEAGPGAFLSSRSTAWGLWMMGPRDWMGPPELSDWALAAVSSAMAMAPRPSIGKRWRNAAMTRTALTIRKNRNNKTNMPRLSAEILARAFITPLKRWNEGSDSSASPEYK
jgi:multidrug efflux pump subunit AcrA (membrane-fusion protein)